MRMNLNYFCCLLLLLASIGNCFAQKRVNRFDLKHRKHGAWKESIITDTTSVVHEGLYHHGQKQGLWKTTIDIDPYVLNVIVTPYTKGKKNGWSSAYDISRYNTDDTARTIKSLYVNDSLTEEFACGYPEPSDIGWNKGTIWPIYRNYIKGDSVFHVRYYNLGFGDSGRVQTITCWTRFARPGSLQHETDYRGPDGAMQIITKTFYRSGQLMSYSDSRLWMNTYISENYHPNGKISSTNWFEGGIQVQDEPNMHVHYTQRLYTFYKNDSCYITQQPDTFLQRKAIAFRFDTNGTITGKSYFVSKSVLASDAAYSIYDPPGTLSVYSYEHADASGKTSIEEYYASGHIKRKTIFSPSDTVSTDSSFYESGAVRTARNGSTMNADCKYFTFTESGMIRSSETQNSNGRFSRTYSDQGVLVKSSGQKDNIHRDTLFYPTGQVSAITEYALNDYGLPANTDYKRTMYYKNGNVQYIETKVNGVYRMEKYNLNGHLIKSE